MFSCHDADKYGYLGEFWSSQCATNKIDYFSMRRVISHKVRLSLIAYSSTSQKNGFKYIYVIYRAGGPYGKKDVLKNI